MEGISATPKPEKAVSPELSAHELVLQSLQHNLEGVALERFMAMSAGLQTPVESFIKWIDDFNEASAEERGKGKYDHDRTLDNHVDVSADFTSPSGFAYTATLHKNGEVTLSSTLAQ